MGMVYTDDIGNIGWNEFKSVDQDNVYLLCE